MFYLLALFSNVLYYRFRKTKILLYVIILCLFRSLERFQLFITFSQVLCFAIQNELATYLYESLIAVPNVRIYGPAPCQTVHRAPLCSFNVENVHPTDIAEILDLQVCILSTTNLRCKC
jgi:hypothetical protein